MAKVTSKLQITIPKRLAEAYDIEPGDEIDWVAAGDAIRVVPSGRDRDPLDCEARLRLFDQASARQTKRQAADQDEVPAKRVAERGWTREQLYVRGRSS